MFGYLTGITIITGITGITYFVYKNCFTNYVKPLSSSNIIDVTKFEIRDSNNELIEMNNVDTEHFSNWLNYIYNIKNEIPTTKTILDGDKKAIIHYTHNNNEYTIHLHEDFDSNHKRDTLKPRRGILMGYLFNINDSKDITEDLKRFLGPNCDFYKGITDTIIGKANYFNDLNHILHNLDLDHWDNIEILDSLGHFVVIDLKKTKILEWNV